ncbi:hypothetical protein ABZY45_27685 [Streptomyces sp. NPDC006516]|uniref:hypothetical protein n=1 Tax=Streptomyces sp. NPDC006516 TaxID=3154309 RepID=UPI0033B3A935
MPLRCRIHPADACPGPWLTPDYVSLVEQRQSLDPRGGTLGRQSVYEDGKAGG